MKMLAVLFVGCLVMGCADSDTGDTGDTTTGTSLVGDVMPLISQSCGGCHTRNDAPFPAAVANGVYYDDVDDLLGLVGTFIVPGDPVNSGFVAILTQAIAVGEGPTLMPPPEMAEAMTDDDVAVVIAWIAEGAQNN